MRGLAAPGDLDFSFGQGGRVLTDLQNGSRDIARGVAVQADGKVLVAGMVMRQYEDINECPILAVERFTPGGILDPSFGEGGKVERLVPGGSGIAVDIAVRPEDGRIFVAGSTIVPNDPTQLPLLSASMDVYSFTTAGAVDTAFGDGGKASVTGGWSKGLALQSDGKILVYGYRATSSDASIVLRFTRDGLPDSSFGSGGQWTSALETNAGRVIRFADMVTLPDGRFLTAAIWRGSEYNEAAVLRFTTAGRLDPTFGQGGILRGISRLAGTALAVQDDGKFLLACIGNETDPPLLNLMRFDLSGVLDSSFGAGGKLSAPMSHGSNLGLNLAVQSGGKITVYGEFFTGTSLPDGVRNYVITSARFLSGGGVDTSYGDSGSLSIPSSGESGGRRRGALQTGGGLLLAESIPRPDGGDFALIHLTDSGSLDTSFGQAGVVSVPATSSSYDFCRSVAVLGDGKVLSLGMVWAPAGYALGLVRHLPGGELDPAFGNNGRLVISAGKASPGECGLAVQPDGKFLIACNVVRDGVYRLVLLRCLPGGPLDPDFGEGGILVTPISSQSDKIDNPGGACVAVLADGKILAAGAQWNGVTYEQAIARYTSEGILDPAFGNAGLAGHRLARSTRCMALQPDGKIVLGGDYSLTRYHASGLPDTTFGTGGLVSLDGQVAPAGVLVLADGNILVANSFIIRRFSTQGSLDATFGDGGSLVLMPPGISSTEMQYYPNVRNGSLTVLGDGRYLFSGWVVTGNYHAFRRTCFLARCTTGGTLDPAFGTAGWVITRTGPDYAGPPGAVVMQGVEKVIAGDTALGKGLDFSLVRYETGPPGAKVRLGSLSGMTSSSVTVSGIINPSGSPASAKFDYNGRSTPVTLSAPDGSLPQSVSVTLPGLAPGGVYTGRFSVTNAGGLNTSDSVTFTVPTRLQEWRARWFGSGANSGPAADTADVDGDGLSNLMEFACGLNPLSGDSLPLSTALNSTGIEFTYIRSKAAKADGCYFVVEYNSVPGGTGWLTNGVTETVLADNGEMEQVRASVPAGSGTRRFVRLTVRRLRGD